MLGQSYKQINFLRSEYVTSKLPTGVSLMNFSKLGKNIDLFIYQFNQFEQDLLVSKYITNIPHHYKGLQFDNLSEYFDVLKCGFKKQLHEMLQFHEQRIYELFEDNDKYLNLYKSLSVGLLLTPLSTIYRNFTHSEYIEYIEEAALLQLWLRTAYGNKYIKLVNALNLDLDLQSNDDMWYMYFTALTDLFTMSYDIDIYNRRFLIAMSQLIFDSRDNFELYLTNGPESMTTHVTYSPTTSKLHITKSGHPLYGTYRTHKQKHRSKENDNYLDDLPVYDADSDESESELETDSTIFDADSFNNCHFKVVKLQNLFYTVTQLLKSNSLSAYLLLSNLHCKMLNACSTDDLNMYRFKRLTRRVQVINYKNLQVRHYNKLTKYLTLSHKKTCTWQANCESNQLFHKFENAFVLCNKFIKVLNIFELTYQISQRTKYIRNIAKQRQQLLTTYDIEDMLINEFDDKYNLAQEYEMSSYQFFELAYATNSNKTYKNWKNLQHAKRSFYLQQFYA